MEISDSAGGNTDGGHFEKYFRRFNEIKHTLGTQVNKLNLRNYPREMKPCVH